MLSRVADSIYWMSRYIERAENVARFINVNLNLMLDLPAGSEEQWEPLVITAGDQARFRELHGKATRENVIRFLAFDPENANSILSCLRFARENARSVREVISSEMWEQLNKFYLMVNDAADSFASMESPHDFFTDVKMASHLFAGVTSATMSHGEGWHFCRLGGLIERADKTTRILDVKYFYLLPAVSYVGTPFDNIQWSAVLRSASALEMYRQRHGTISPEKVAEFLILDREFPRSVHFCLIKAEQSLHSITGTHLGTFRNAAEQRLGQVCSELAYARIEDVISAGLHEFLDGLQTKLNHVGDAIFDSFFALRPMQRAAYRKGA
ncbi:MAG TPA: alpha-E domain-containing protein [Planctomycetota bacterium]|nr:alpha-E domain-containing protein [Planctomycetota bacterium]